MSRESEKSRESEYSKSHSRSKQIETKPIQSDTFLSFAPQPFTPFSQLVDPFESSSCTPSSSLDLQLHLPSNSSRHFPSNSISEQPRKWQSSPEGSSLSFDHPPPLHLRPYSLVPLSPLHQKSKVRTSRVPLPRLLDQLLDRRTLSNDGGWVASSH